MIGSLAIHCNTHPNKLKYVEFDTTEQDYRNSDAQTSDIDVGKLHEKHTTDNNSCVCTPLHAKGRAELSCTSAASVSCLAGRDGLPHCRPQQATFECHQRPSVGDLSQLPSQAERSAEIQRSDSAALIYTPL